MYELLYARPVNKELRMLRKNDLERVVQLISSLSYDPRPAAALKLKGSENLYRIRQGRYRIVHSVDDGVLVVLILRVAHRKDAYKNL